VSGLELYLLIAPMVLLALGWGFALWIRYSAGRQMRPPAKHGKAG
jgi:hypothetical protein